ncbi:MAG TPA: aminopeptidase N [Pseudomonadales bacterium]|nr:aminopeptidase N [Pseudomonadales bacterium]
MRENHTPKAIRLADYRQPDYWIDAIDLYINLNEDVTQVRSVLQVRANEATNPNASAPLKLAGVDLVLKQVWLDQQTLSEDQYSVDAESLTLHQPKTRFELIIENEIKPQLNTSLEGLYKSKGMFCTQCEPEGFRKITYYLDRPDVMAAFSTTIEGDQTLYPILLSNGNPVARGVKENGRHWVRWEDPFKKPSYLFALVGGNLSCFEDKFITCSNREIKLQIFVEPHDLDKCEHAMESLKRAMRWDEEVYGREYDLDIYMIVAVSHFNMGAMENKGLNIFNTSCVLAKPETTTDQGFQRVEAVIAHEYFHNWSGNRVTCRDWFQLSLKEGFTVFRDEEFSADQNSRAVKRIESVTFLRTTQFAEDSGPMSHPIRPDSYIEINNFYTATVYEKGAEVVRMIHTLLGEEKFRKGTDLYFSRHDGQAATCDDFVKAMEDANSIDLTYFKRWYGQSGTPIVDVTGEYDAKAKTYRLDMRQHTPATADQKEKLPLLIPVKMGLISPNGEALPVKLSGDAEISNEKVLLLKDEQQSFLFESVPVEPTPSLLRGFSAPVKLRFAYSLEQLAFLMQHDSDGFNRWDAGQRLFTQVILTFVNEYRNKQNWRLPDVVFNAVGHLLQQESEDKAMLAMTLTLPSEAFLAEQMLPIAVAEIHEAREFVRHQLAQRFFADWEACYLTNSEQGAYSAHASAIARRSLKNVALSYMMAVANETAQTYARNQFNSAHNMTDELGALRLLVHSPLVDAQPYLQQFYQKWEREALVVDQWFACQATAPTPDVLQRVTSLMQHPAFELTNPNRVRALIANFCNGNPAQFHRADGQGYQFLADIVIQLNKLNPQIASRMLSALTRWKKYDAQRQQLQRDALTRIRAEENLSPDVFEVVSKSLLSD